MRILLLLTILLPSLALAGLVEVNSSQYLRESGNPQAQYLEVTLDNAGEIRVSNVNLQDGYIELAASTDVLLNGSSLMQPFSLPTGGSAVFPLEAGTHYLEVTLRGKPGGGLKVSFYEDKPDTPEKGTGFEILNDGTVLQKSSGLIWHRFPNSPGLSDLSRDFNYPASRWSEYRLRNYFLKLNGGEFGTDAADGNAGHSDWRLPTAAELMSLVDLRFGDGCKHFYDSEQRRCFEYYRLSATSGETSFNVFGEPWFLDEGWGDRRLFVGCRSYLSSNLSREDLLDGGEWVWSPWSINFDDGQLWRPVSNGCVWPVRGGTPE